MIFWFFFNITSTYTVIWHLLFCGADQDNQCMWDWNERLRVSATRRGSNNNLTCFHCKVSVESVRAPLSGPLKLASLFILPPLVHCPLLTFKWGYIWTFYTGMLNVGFEQCINQFHGLLLENVLAVQGSENDWVKLVFWLPLTRHHWLFWAFWKRLLLPT